MQIGQEKRMMIKDFFSMIETDGGQYEVETPQGWKDVGELYLKKQKPCYIIRTTSGKTLGGSNDHLVFADKGWKMLEKVNISKHKILTKDGYESLLCKESIGKNDTYDWEVLSEEHAYYSNDIVSHNSCKTTLARIMAMALNCSKGDQDPCLTCDNCMMALERNAMHITEINMAQLNKKEDAEEIVANMYTRPLTGRNKIYIFDEAQQLTSQAQNLLLKNLEEPPDNTYIFLCTSEPHKLIKALVSRCQQYEFKPPVPADIAKLLGDVMKQENWSMSDDDKKKFFEYVQGCSMREILKAIDQAVKGGVDSLSSCIGESAEDIEICRLLMNSDFKTICDKLATMKKNNTLDAEGLRLCIFGYLKGCLVREGFSTKGAKIAGVMAEFSTPYFESKADNRLHMNIFNACVKMSS